MSHVIGFLNSITLEQWRTYASIFQAAGVFIGAGLVYWLTKKLEPHKYEYRKKEIIFSKRQDKRLAAIETASGLVGRLLYELTEMLTQGRSYENHPSSRVALYDLFQDRIKIISEISLELDHSLNSNLSYIPRDQIESLSALRISARELAQDYSDRVLNTNPGGGTRGPSSDELRIKIMELRNKQISIITLLETELESEADTRSHKTQ